MRLLLIRHTAPDIAAGMCYGRLDVPALPAERDAWLADWDAGRHPGQPWSDYQRLVCSPARRCRSLATALSRRLVLPLNSDPAWQEMDFGAWEGQSWDAIARSAINAWAADPLDYAPGAGESVRAMMQRVLTAHKAWRQLEQDTILVTHGGVIRLLQAWHAARPADDLPPDPATLRSACQQALTLPTPMPGSQVLLQWKRFPSEP
ncbi:MAG: histidine phosphatase family protein [Castellaniella sp.]|uniref:histidine phosphatase family protein n=1 Tax=Castellaniella sp. TaxID=1955812 RepID=UPI003C735F60